MTEAPKAEEQFSNSNSAPETPVEEKKAHSINGNDPSNTPDPNSGSVPTTELDEKALFHRLSPSSHQALNEADGIRTALGQQEVHMEHLIAGLLLKKGGPTEELLGKAKIDVISLGSVVETSFPDVGSYKPSELNSLPRMSDHVRRALVAARDIAGAQESDPVRSRHILYGALSISNCHVIQALLARGISKEDINLYRLPSGSNTPPRPVISGYTSDDTEGPDLLDMKKEVEALCSVLAAKDVKPPLSLGLFGEWGSGKSFFMRMMQERIEKLKKAAQGAEGETAYCKNIVQLKFNAWHYIDKDLWASLTSEIFEGLAGALVKKDDADSEYKRAHLLANTIKSKDELAKAEREKNEAEAKLRESEENLKKLERDASAIEANLTPKALVQGTLNVAIRQPEVRDTVEETKKELNAKLEVAAKDLNYPTSLAMESEVKTQIQDLDGIWGSVRALAIAIRNTKGIRRWQLFTAAVVIVLVVSLLAVYRASLVGLLGSVIVLLVGVIAPVAPLIPGMLRAVRIIKQVQEERTRLIEEARQSSRAAFLQKVLNAQQRVEEAQQRVEKVSAEVRIHEQEMETLRADRQMSDFIKQRQASTVYTKHLGVIAQAREDFEKLSMLLAKEKKDAEKGPPAGEEEQLLPRIDRIILYIDDLDRCPEKQVVDVLQAVHLLLAFPLFIVVVGVDSRWLLYSLKQHSKAFQSEASENDGLPDEEHAHWQSTPLDYLEKIFQISFTLRRMQATGFAQLVDVLTSQQKSTPPAEVKNEKIISKEAAVGRDGMTDHDDTPTADVGITEPSDQHPTPVPDPLGASPKAFTHSVKVLPHEEIDLNPGYLHIEDWEREYMKKLYRFIPSPRAAKRYVNVYRLLRASIDDQKLQAFIGNKDGGQHQYMLLLLAMLLGHPAETTEILRALLQGDPSETWWNFIDSFNSQAASTTSSNNGTTPDIKSRAATSTPSIDSTIPNNAREAETEGWRQLLEKLEKVRSLVRKDQPCKDFVVWVRQVARYSYQSRLILFEE
jgi:hypothetical protein